VVLRTTSVSMRASRGYKGAQVHPEARRKSSDNVLIYATSNPRTLLPRVHEETSATST